jgi:glutamate mutase epsilon subunit
MSILSTVINFIKRTPSTAKAVAGFNKAITELEAVIEHHNFKADVIDAEIAIKVAAQAAAKEAAAEADKIAKRIRKLVA